MTGKSAVEESSFTIYDDKDSPPMGAGRSIWEMSVWNHTRIACSIFSHPSGRPSARRRPTRLSNRSSVRLNMNASTTSCASVRNNWGTSFGRGSGTTTRNVHIGGSAWTIKCWIKHSSPSSRAAFDARPNSAASSSLTIATRPKLRLKIYLCGGSLREPNKLPLSLKRNLPLARCRTLCHVLLRLEVSPFICLDGSIPS